MVHRGGMILFNSFIGLSNTNDIIFTKGLLSKTRAIHNVESLSEVDQKMK